MVALHLRDHSIWERVCEVPRLRVHEGSPEALSHSTRSSVHAIGMSRQAAPSARRFRSRRKSCRRTSLVQYQLSCLRKPDPEGAADGSHASTYASDETRSETGSEVSFITESAESSWAVESHVSCSLCVCVLEADECSVSSPWQREGFLEADECSISSS